MKIWHVPLHALLTVCLIVIGCMVAMRLGTAWMVTYGVVMGIIGLITLPIVINGTADRIIHVTYPNYSDHKKAKDQP